MYKKAMRVNAVFQKHGLEIAFFYVFDGVTWMRNAFGMDTGTYKGSRVLSFDELKVEAAKYGVCCPSDIADDAKALHVFSLSDLLGLKPEEYVLYPVLKPGFYCLIYGGSGVAKTWVALHLAIALSQGETPFDKWAFRGNAPLNVLYVAGEMSVNEFGERLRKLLEKQEANPCFKFIREDLDLTNADDQERIVKVVNEQKSKIVVLDNLSTLATNGHMEGQFEIVLALIRNLQATGIIVILVHHENREGDFKGSGKIELVADQSLHLFSAGNGEKIELLVRAEKVRSTSKSEQTAFRTVFDPKKPVSVWPTFDLTAEERHRLDIDTPLDETGPNIRKARSKNQLAWEYLDFDDRAVAVIGAMLRGTPDDEIANTVGVVEEEIADFKKQHGISSEVLKLHLPEIYERVKKVEKNITPDMLAIEIWNSLRDKD
jgi:KaiC/GvpD/RAD55 family RecA-like ATPase